MAKKNKNEVLKVFSANLQIFRPDLHSHFMCPTCLKIIELKRREEISEAHIVPKIAGGKLITYLCRRCNSLFGTKQDKWFGEMVRLKRTGAKSIVQTNVKKNSFLIDDIRVNGNWEYSDKGLEFNWFPQLNSPATNKMIRQKFDSYPSNLNINVDLPIMGKEGMIDIGLLTAGYLLWFAALGYSWVLQKHLDPIRRQILNPEKNILTSRFVAHCENVSWLHPWIGLMTLKNETVLVAHLLDFCVVFPPVDRKDIYERLGNDFEATVSNMRELPVKSKLTYIPALSVVAEQRLLVAPDNFTNQTIPPEHSYVIFFPPGSLTARILRPVSDNEYETLSKNPAVKRLHIDARSV